MQVQETLTSQLANYKAGFISRVPPERVTMMETATSQLKETGIESSAKKSGDLAPDIQLPDAKGKLVSVHELLHKGPVVIVFYRGGWCPYCNLELRAWQTLLPELNRIGASLIAISPQTPDNSLTTAEKNELTFHVLSDSDLKVSTDFGIAFELPAELVALYGSVGNNLPEINGNGKWVLPVPATYVIDQNGIIKYSHVEADYRERSEPEEVLKLVKALVNEPDLG